MLLRPLPSRERASRRVSALRLGEGSLRIHARSFMRVSSYAPARVRSCSSLQHGLMLCGLMLCGDGSAGNKLLAVPGLGRQHAEVDADLAQRLGIFVLGILPEDQLKVGRAVQPAILVDLGLELTWRP